MARIKIRFIREICLFLLIFCGVNVSHAATISLVPITEDAQADLLGQGIYTQYSSFGGTSACVMGWTDEYFLADIVAEAGASLYTGQYASNKIDIYGDVYSFSSDGFETVATAGIHGSYSLTIFSEHGSTGAAQLDIELYTFFETFGGETPAGYIEILDADGNVIYSFTSEPIGPYFDWETDELIYGEPYTVNIDIELTGSPGGEGRFDFNAVAVEPNPVPIPGAVWLLGTGLVGLVGIRKRRRAQPHRS